MSQTCSAHALHMFGTCLEPAGDMLFRKVGFMCGSFFVRVVKLLVQSFDRCFVVNRVVCIKCTADFYSS